MTMMSGDVNGFASLLAEDAILYTDGGGKRSAALNPIYGRERIVRFFEGASHKGWIPAQVRPARINGLPGFVGYMPDGVETLAIQIDGERIVALYAIRNPDKLRHLA
jgi:RNA polymerase sigma-70 factor (ECF subfamily)